LHIKIIGKIFGALFYCLYYFFLKPTNCLFYISCSLHLAGSMHEVFLRLPENLSIATIFGLLQPIISFAQGFFCFLPAPFQPVSEGL